MKTAKEYREIAISNMVDGENEINNLRNEIELLSSMGFLSLGINNLSDSAKNFLIGKGFKIIYHCAGSRTQFTIEWA